MGYITDDRFILAQNNLSAITAGRAALLSHIFCTWLLSPAIIVLNWNHREINIFKTTNVHSGHIISTWICAFTERMDTADRTKMMFDYMLVKCVGAHGFFRRQKMKRCTRYKPQ